MPSSPDKDTRSLTDLIASTLALLHQFSNSLVPSENLLNDSTPIENPPNPLSVLADSAKLVKAHTTKLSLLAINKPFTPSAITKVLKELAGTCLPAMMSAVQICAQEMTTWGSMMGREVQARVRRVFKEMEMLLQELSSIASGSDATARRDSLSSTGVVWESCDACIELEQLGVAGLAVQKAEQYRETIKDAIKELQEWVEGDDPDNEGHSDGLLDSDDEGVDGDRDSLEDIFNAANSMPKDRPELKALAEEADAKLKKVVILYAAVVKRRIGMFKNIKKLESQADGPVARLEALMLHLKRIPHQIDEMASFFYDLDEPGAKAVLQRCISEAKSACAVMECNWDGQEDAFSTWLERWKAAWPSRGNARFLAVVVETLGAVSVRFHNAAIARPAKPSNAPSYPNGPVIAGAAALVPVDDDEADAALAPLPPPPPVADAAIEALVVVALDAVLPPAEQNAPVAVEAGVYVWLLAARAELQMPLVTFSTSARCFSRISKAVASL